ncbi:MAG TPA: hypothetical protein VFQ91_22005 [Bryobacteraceae bacterium]|nr:hypothetical protein [Bryobacteraceae bacterium]
MMRFIYLLLIAFSLHAQNPLAADPFSGSFQNAEMALELSRKGPEYSGVIRFGGQALPVKAKAAAGKLEGTFISQGQSYAFQAARNGGQLSFTTDGTTHTLTKAGAQPAAPTTAVPVAAAPTGTEAAIVGSWQSPQGIVRILADGSAVIGDKSQQWKLNGSVITFEGNGQTLQVPFELSGDTWTWRFPDGHLVLSRLPASGNGSGADLAKAIAGAWQGPNGVAQFNLDGTATVAGVQYHYTAQGNRLTLTGSDGTFLATVQLAGAVMNWAVNGKTFSFQRAATTWAVGGGGTAAVPPELVGRWCESTNINNNTGNYGRSTCIVLLADGTYQYQSDFDANGQTAGGAYGTGRAGGDTGTWTATADTITSRSPKSGVRTFKLEKRNHPKTGDPMIVLDGKEYTTAFQKAPWP